MGSYGWTFRAHVATTKEVVIHRPNLKTSQHMCYLEDVLRLHPLQLRVHFLPQLRLRRLRLFLRRPNACDLGRVVFRRLGL